MRITRFLPVCLVLLLAGCFVPGQSMYRNDPLTGGVDSRSSALLHIPLPSGLQYYPSHSRVSGGARNEGLEVFRGYVDQGACGARFYDSLRQAGWNMRMRENVGARAIYVYEKGDELAVIVFQAQGMLTIVQIWLGSRLADNSGFGAGVRDDSWTSLPGETYGPAGQDAPPQGAEEKWGVQEREL